MRGWKTEHFQAAKRSMLSRAQDLGYSCLCGKRNRLCFLNIQAPSSHINFPADYGTAVRYSQLQSYSKVGKNSSETWHSLRSQAAGPIHSTNRNLAKRPQKIMPCPCYSAGWHGWPHRGQLGHATRAGMPLLFMCSLTSEIATSFRWKMPAARAAAALVFLNTCAGKKGTK
jgi:hypothetical protein